VTRLDRTKRGGGIKDQDDRSSGMEILIADTLAKVNPTDPLILGKQVVPRNLKKQNKFFIRPGGLSLLSCRYCSESDPHLVVFSNRKIDGGKKRE
jgi:hypothetical protein